MAKSKYQYPVFQDPNVVGFSALGPALISLFFFPMYTGSYALGIGGWGIYLGLKSKSKKCLFLSLVSFLIGGVTVYYYFVSQVGFTQYVL